MKKYTKLVTLFLAAAMALSLAACSSGKAAGKITGIYLSPAQLSYINMRPEYNYYLTTFTQQEITLMDDNTYCLVVSASTFSALELSESTSDAKGNERENSITKFENMLKEAIGLFRKRHHNCTPEFTDSETDTDSIEQQEGEMSMEEYLTQPQPATPY